MAVVTGDSGEKSPIVGPQFICDSVILDAELTLGLPPAITAATGADAMVHATRSSLDELGDKISEGDKKKIDDAIEGVEKAMKSDDKETIEAATNRLTEAAQIIYQQAAAAAEAGAQDAASSAEAATDDVVDAEFEEVDDKDK